MSDYLNEDYCEFVNDASASSFGWNFQSNAGIFLFLKYLKEAESIKIESKLQDIEINLSGGGKILAQAKSSQDYTIATDKKEKFKDRLLSDPAMVYHERFEFSNRVIQDFTSFRKRQPVGTREVEKLFIKTQGNDYCAEFQLDGDTEKTEYITKAFVFKLLLNYRNMVKIQAGIGVSV